MNMAAFAVIVARERETGLGDSIDAITGLGRERPWLAWPMTISMLALAGIPATAGFIGKFYLIDAAVAGGYTWLGVVIVIGSMISLGYYLPVVAAMWMREAPAGAGSGSTGTTAPPAPVPGSLPALAGGSPELDEQGALAPAGGDGEAVGGAARGLQPEVAFVAVLAAAATIFFGVDPAAAVRPRASRRLLARALLTLARQLLVSVGDDRHAQTRSPTHHPEGRAHVRAIDDGQRLAALGSAHDRAGGVVN